MSSTAGSIRSSLSQRNGSISNPFKKRSTSTAEIHLEPTPSDGRPDPRCWFTNESIRGSVVFRPVDGVNLTQPKVLLKGTVDITTTEKSCTHMQPTCRRETLDILAASSEINIEPEHSTHDNEITIPFSFNLRELEIDTSWVTYLPPSLTSKKDGWRSSETQYNITYGITATAYSGESIEAREVAKISILPVWDNDDDDDGQSDATSVPGECFAARELPSPLKSRLRKSRPSGVYIAAEEPKCLELDPRSDTVRESTKIPFLVKISSPDSEAMRRAPLPARCEVKAQLVQKDTYTFDGVLKLSAGVSTTLAEEQVSSQTHMSQQQNSSFDLCWERYDACPTESFSLTKFSLPFLIKDDELLAPSFFTPLLTRKYSIAMVLSFPDTFRQSWKLALPLEIRYTNSVR